MRFIIKGARCSGQPSDTTGRSEPLFTHLCKTGHARSRGLPPLPPSLNSEHLNPALRHTSAVNNLYVLLSQIVGLPTQTYPNALYRQAAHARARLRSHQQRAENKSSSVAARAQRRDKPIFGRFPSERIRNVCGGDVVPPVVVRARGGSVHGQGGAASRAAAVRLGHHHVVSVYHCVQTD